MQKQWLPKSGLLWQALCRGNAGGGSELGNRIKKKKRAPEMNYKSLGSEEKVQKEEEMAKLGQSE